MENGQISDKFHCKPMNKRSSMVKCNVENIPDYINRTIYKNSFYTERNIGYDWHSYRVSRLNQYGTYFTRFVVVFSSSCIYDKLRIWIDGELKFSTTNVKALLQHNVSVFLSVPEYQESPADLRKLEYAITPRRRSQCEELCEDGYMRINSTYCGVCESSLSIPGSMTCECVSNAFYNGTGCSCEPPFQNTGRAGKMRFARNYDKFVKNSEKSENF